MGCILKRIKKTNTIDSNITQIQQGKNVYTFTVNEKELKRLPQGQPFICIVNQLLDGVDDEVLLTVFSKLGIDFKIITTKKAKGKKYLSIGSRLQPTFFKKLKKGLQQAKNEGVSTAILVSFSKGRLEDIGKRTFLKEVMKVVKKSEIPIVPIRLNTDVHPFFHSGLRAKFLKKTTQNPIQLTVRIGSVISVANQQKFSNANRFRKFIQSKIFALGSSLKVKKFFKNPFSKNGKSESPIAKPIAAELIERDIANLTFKNFVVAQAEFDILIADAKDLPNVLLEIGRLREITFRKVGEGTGKNRDLDEFDLYYQHLIIWDRKNKQLVGGYRIGQGSQIFSRYGLEGFYIHSLFKIKKGFFSTMMQSLELGRSYIVPSYQKKRLPLFLLWKGILFYLLKNPEFRYVFGPVSISKYYSNVSKSLMIAFIKKYYFNHDFAQFLAPRKPFKVQNENVDIEVLLENLEPEMKNLDCLVKDIEPNHFRIPVLFRQYLKLNARFISFNVDPNFSDCLDGFIILDLNDIPYSMLESLKKEI